MPSTSPAIAVPEPDTSVPASEPVTHHHHHHSYGQDKAKILARLRRIEGQVRGVAKMVEEDQYCIDILTQLSAIISSSRNVGLLVLEDHIRGCVVNAEPEEQDARLLELNQAIERFVRSVG